MSNLSNFTDGAVIDLPRTDGEACRRAARTVASRAANATDAAELLDALGLTAQDGLRPPQAPSPGRGWPGPAARGKR